jgi:MFS family permease
MEGVDDRDKSASFVVGAAPRRSTSSLEDDKMSLTARIRFSLAALVLAAGYFYLLIYIIGWTSAHYWPKWWFDVFPSRHAGAVMWLVTLHSAAVLLAALPIGIAAVLIERKRPVLLGLIAALLATLASLAPSFVPTIWQYVWSHPVFFVTDQLKLIVAVPFIAWVLRAASSNNRLERSRGHVFVGPRSKVDDLDK